MEEKIYKTMSGSGALNITLGVVAIVVGIVIILGSSCIIVIKNKNRNRKDYYNE